MKNQFLTFVTAIGFSAFNANTQAFAQSYVASIRFAFEAAGTELLTAPPKSNMSPTQP